MPFNPKTILFTDVINPLNEQIVAFPQTVDGREGWTVGYRTNYSKEMLEMGYEDGVFSLVFYAGIDIWKAAELAKEMDGQDDWKNVPDFRSKGLKVLNGKFLESLTDSEIEQGFV